MWTPLGRRLVAARLIINTVASTEHCQAPRRPARSVHPSAQHDLKRRNGPPRLRRTPTGWSWSSSSSRALSLSSSTNSKRSWSHEGQSLLSY